MHLSYVTCVQFNYGVLYAMIIRLAKEVSRDSKKGRQSNSAVINPFHNIINTSERSGIRWGEGEGVSLKALFVDSALPLLCFAYVVQSFQSVRPVLFTSRV